MRRRWLLALLVTLAACRRSESAPRVETRATPSSTPSGSAAPPAAGSVSSASTSPTAGAMSLVGLGDVELARDLGRAILRDPSLEPLRGLRSLLATADLRFANLESPLAERGGETMSPNNPLVFVGPPAGAAVLRRAGIDVVSTANNHAWDYGEPALRETLDLLEGAGVGHVGTGRRPGEASEALVLERASVRVAFVAGTAVWNQGPLVGHVARELVASDADLLRAVAIARARPDVDIVVASLHGGEEYQDAPLVSMRARMQALVDSGADVVLGHHPHVMQGIELYRGRPVFYSLGDVTMRMHTEHPLTELGLAARLVLRRGEAPLVEACPFRIRGSFPELLTGADAGPVRRLARSHLIAISRGLGGLDLGPADADGCMKVVPASR